MKESTNMIWMSDPKYQSSIVSSNADGTYEVKHSFLYSCGKTTSIIYPRVKIYIDAALDMFQPFNVFPFRECEVLANNDSKELFTINVKN